MLFGRGESGRIGTVLFGLGESGRIGTVLLGRGESGRMGTVLLLLAPYEMAIFVTTMRAIVTMTEKNLFLLRRVIVISDKINW